MISIQKSRLHNLTWLPWFAAAALAGVVVSGWYVINHQEDIRSQKESAAAAQLVEVLIRRDLAARMIALQRFAHRKDLVSLIQSDTQDSDVADYFGDQPGYQAIEWADASLQVRWILPLQANGPAQDFDFSKTPDVQRAALQAKMTRESVLVPRTNPGQAESVMAAYVPLYEDRQFKGLLIGIFAVKPWLDAVLLREDDLLRDVSIEMGKRLVYSSRGELNEVEKAWSENRVGSLYGLDWTIYVKPANPYLSAIYSRLSVAVLLLGLILSAFFGWIVHAAMSARLQTQLLHSSTSRLTTLLENLPGMAYRFLNQENWSAEFVSEGCFELCGYTKRELEDHSINWNDLVHPGDRASLRTTVQKAIDVDQPYESEYRIITRDGQEKWVWSRGRLVHMEEEEGKRAYLEGLVTDITSQKKAATDLINAEAYAKAVVDTAAEAVITIDTHGRIETFNWAAQNMFGYSTGDIVGKNVRILMPEPYYTNHDQYIERYLQSHQAHVIGKGRDVTGRRKDGSLFPIRVSVSEVVSQSERKLVGLIRDLSEQRAAEQEAREHRERLAHVDRLNMLGEMATGIAHEINQPLSAMSMYAQSGIRFLEHTTPRLDRLRDALEKLSIQAHRAGAIIERMQQLGKQRESRLERIDCNELIGEVHYLAETEAHIRDMMIELDLCPEPRSVFGDPVQIQQVVLNLLRNGMEAMEIRNNRNENHIVLRTECTDNGFKVSVIDSGVGVSTDVAELLYQPFSTTKKTGMGLGLSICRSIISAHGGQMGFINNQAGGATFYFTLPYATRENI